MKNTGYYEAERRWLKSGLAIFFTLFLALWFGISFYGMTNALLISRNGVSAVGIVDSVRRVASTESDGFEYYISFRHHEHSYQVSNRVDVLPYKPIYQVGERVPVKFMLDDPGRAIIDSDREKWVVYTLMILIGCLVLWVAVYLIRKI